MKTILFLIFAVAGGFAQSTHSVTLTWTDTLNPAGTTLQHLSRDRALLGDASLQ